MRPIPKRRLRRTLAFAILLAPLLLAAERPPAAPPNALPDERIDRIVSELRSKFATAGPTARASSAGAVVLDEERVHFATARIGPDGKPHVDCSKGPRAAARAVLEPAATPAQE